METRRIRSIARHMEYLANAITTLARVNGSTHIETAKPGIQGSSFRMTGKKPFDLKNE